jgi:hypothetical protein
MRVKNEAERKAYIAEAKRLIAEAKAAGRDLTKSESDRTFALLNAVKAFDAKGKSAKDAVLRQVDEVGTRMVRSADDATGWDDVAKRLKEAARPPPSR